MVPSITILYQYFNLDTVQELQVLLFNTNNSININHSLVHITNNSIKNQSFVYSQLNDQTDLFLTFQFSISYLFVCLFVWLVGFYGVSTFVGYLMLNPFLYKNSSISNNLV